MRKKIIQNLLDATNEKLKKVLLENQQLKEEIEHYKQTDEAIAQEHNDNISKIESLQDENSQLKTELEEYKHQKESQISEFEEEINKLNMELNTLKGEHFDTCKYAENLKERLESLQNSENTTENVTFAEIPLPPPKIERIIPIEEKDKDAFDYASDIISKAVIDAGKLKNTLSNYSCDLVSELITLALGKTEMLKSDILQTVMSDMVFDAKKQYIDKIYAETLEYFDGLLGQITTNE